MPAIIGFEMKAEHLENVFKLSQNRDEKSYLNIIAKLLEIGGNSALIAKELIKRKATLFPEGVEWDASKFDS
jgi:transcriptional regulator